MEYRYLEEPCRNFCILASTIIVDPKDGREKIVLSSFVSGGAGRLVFIETQSGAGESIELPGDEGAWALLCLNNEKLLVGTCGLQGFLHCLDLKTRKWAISLKDENETYIWNLVLGSDGMVYGGTYPGCVLLRYNSAEHILENMGKVSEYEGNMYSRTVYGEVPGRIFISCGQKKSHVAVWDMETRSSKQFGRDGAVIKEVNGDFICTVTGNKLDFYDPYTLKPFLDILLPQDKLEDKLESLNHDKNNAVSKYVKNLRNEIKDIRLPENAEALKTLSNGDITGVRGQEYFILKKSDEKVNLKKIPVDAPPTQILALTSSPNGRLWGSSNFGQTIFSYNTKNGDYWNSAAVCNRGGEVYGMQYINGKIFMATYAGGDHVVYDPSKPWDQINNVNPITLKSAGPDLIRPHGRSTIGPDGAFWTGWTAKYGTYGGGISRVDTDTLDVISWYDPIPEQEIAWLASGEKYLYFTTDGFGNGLPNKVEPFYLCVWNLNGKIIWKMQFPEGVTPGIIGIVGNYGLVNVGDEIKIFRCGSMEFTGSIKLKSPISCIIKYNDDTAAVFSGKDLLLVKPATCEADCVLELPGVVKAATIDHKGELYFAQGSHIYKVEN